MAQYNITIDSEILHHLFLKGAKDEGTAKLFDCKPRPPSKSKLNLMKEPKKDKPTVTATIREI